MGHEIQEQPLGIRIAAHLPRIFFGVAMIFTFACSVVWVAITPRLFNSPDENATYLFASQFQKTSVLGIPTNPNPSLPGVVRPRSMLRTETQFIPVGVPVHPLFLGIVGKLAGSWGILLITPILALGALCAFQGILRPFFGKRIALLATALVLIHPAYLMYTIRGLYPNMLFLSCFIFATYLFIKILTLPRADLPKENNIELQIPWYLELGKKRHVLSALFGIFFGLAIALRPNEVAWLIGTMAVMFIVFRKRLAPLSFFLFGSGLMFVLIPALYLNYLYYGGIVRSGYHISGAQALLAPFVFQPQQILKIFQEYYVKIFWWNTLLVVMGFLYLVRRGVRDKLRNRLLVWVAFGVGLGVWLLLYYGSFPVADRLDHLPSVGTSFTRYFLPVYFFFTPLMAFALVFVSRRCKVGKILACGSVVVLVVFSLKIAFWGTDESLLQIRDTLFKNEILQKAIIGHTKEKGIVFTERSDKVIFPRRDVVSQFHEPGETKDIGPVVQSRLPLYYETIAPSDAVVRENETFWHKYNLDAQSGIDVGFGHTLYQLKYYVK